MKTIHTRLFATSLLLACTLQPAAAHRFWLLPSSTVLSGEKPWVTVDAAISNSLFFPDHRAPALEAISVTGPDGSPVPLQNGSVGKYRTTFDVELTQPGTYSIATVRSTLIATWEDNGETSTWRGDAESFAAQNLKDKPGVRVNRNDSRVETFVTAGEPTTPKPSGKGLELLAGGNHPNDLFSGETVTLLLHGDGKPAANVEVTIVKGDDRYRNEAGETTVTTNEAGEFEFTFPEPGRYWLNATAEGSEATIEGIPMSGRMSYTATLEVLPE
jgi:hypothetical protein